MATAHKQPLIFIPGWNMQGAIFGPYFIKLKEHFDCMQFTPPPGGYNQAVQALVDTIHSFHQPPILLGWSMGGQLALLAAQKIPVAGLVLLNSAAIFSADQAGKDGFAQLCARDFARAIKYFQELMGTNTMEEAIQIKRCFINDKVRGLAYLKELHTRDLTDIARQTTVKTLIIHTEQDQIIPAKQGLALHAIMPNSEILLLPGKSHFPFLTACDKIVAQIIENFVVT